MMTIQEQLRALIQDCETGRIMLSPHEHNKYERLIGRLATIVLAQHERLLAIQVQVDPQTTAPLFSDAADPLPVEEGEPSGPLDDSSEPQGDKSPRRNRKRRND